MNEAQIQQRVVHMLRRSGCAVAECNRTTNRPSGTFTTPGMTDLVIVHRGRVELVEVKTETGYLTKDEAHFHEACRKAGYHVIVVYGYLAALDFVTALLGGRVLQKAYRRLETEKAPAKGALPACRARIRQGQGGDADATSV